MKVNYYKIMVKNTPWIKHWYSSRRRCADKNCKDYKDYGARNIKCLLLKEEIKELWFRDKAYLMKKPTVDRIDNDGNYCIENCRFLEMSENVRQRNLKYGKPILQYDLKGNFIKEWSSAVKASKNVGVTNITINAQLKGRLLTAGGFIWRYKHV